MVMALQKAFARKHFEGLIETVPAYSSLGVFYDISTIKKNHPSATAYDFVKNFTHQLLGELHEIAPQNKKPPVQVPVYYNGKDLNHLASHHELSVEEIIRIHTQKIVRVFMIGFLPGFAYMGKIDDRIATPRLSIPRTHVIAGSVGIAGSQTGIYPLDSPGGWQLIGQTPIKIFDVKTDTPCLFQAGDLVQFIAINKKDFDKLNEY